MVDRNFVLALAVIVIGMFLMPTVGYILGVIIVPILIAAAAYIIYSMIKSMQ